MKTFICLTCQKSFPLKPGTSGKYCSLSHQMEHRNSLLKEKRIQNYILAPKCCKQCQNPLDYEKRNNKFCNHSCAATFTNLNSSPDRKRGPDKNLNKKERSVNKKERSKTCKVCNCIFVTTGPSKHCSKECIGSTIRTKIKSYISKNPSHKLNRNPYRQSYMEKSFEEWICSKGFTNSIHGYLKEVTFYNEETKKYGRADFVFPMAKVIIELDGSHHEQRKELDAIRDLYLTTRGWEVIRITHKEYRKKSKVDVVLEKINGAGRR